MVTPLASVPPLPVPTSAVPPVVVSVPPSMVPPASCHDPVPAFKVNGVSLVRMPVMLTVPLLVTVPSVDVAKVTKGYHLERQDRVVCALSFDDACIAMNISFGVPAYSAWQGCASTTETDTAVEVPLDTPITLTIEDPTVPPQKPPLCDTPPAR